METMRIFKSVEPLSWEFDEEADVLYISVGEPRPAVGIDIGEGVIVRLDEESKEVVGLTIVGLKARILKHIAEEQSG